MQIARITGTPLYDTFRHSGATLSAQTLRYFTNGVGANASGFTSSPYKTLAETNLIGGSGLPNGMSFRVEKVGVYCRISDAIATPGVQTATEQFEDIGAILRNSVLQFEQGSDLLTLGPAEFFPAGCGLVGASVGTGGATGAYSQASVVNGASDQRGMYSLPEPIILEDGTNFQFNLKVVRDTTIQLSTNAFDISVLLWGISFQRIQP